MQPRPETFIRPAPHSLYVMAHSHPTVVPIQATTDEMAVFWDDPQDTVSDLTLVARVEVPRYAVPESGAKRLSFDQQVSMAVQFAVTERFPDVNVGIESLSELEGAEFMVMHDLSEPMAFATFERNPTVAGCWNPNRPDSENQERSRRRHASTSNEQTADEWGSN